MGTCKILIDGVGIDLTQDTVAANKMLSGTKAHDSNGDSITGSIPSKAAQTYTPGTSAQTIDAGQYLGGVQTIQGDVNLVAENIKKDVNIFGVMGTHEGGISEDDEFAWFLSTAPIAALYPEVSSLRSYAFNNCTTLTTASFPACTTIGASAFGGCTTLTTVSFPVCTTTGTYAFGGCTRLMTANFPVCTTIGDYMFNMCTALMTVSFPVCTTIGASAFYMCGTALTTANFPACMTIGAYAFNGCTGFTTANFPVCMTIGSYAFSGCTDITTASFPACMTIGSYAFRGCRTLVSFYLTGSSYVTLSASNAFSSTPIGGYTTSTGGVYGSIYVPASMLESYKTRTNWSFFSSRFVGI